MDEYIRQRNNLINERLRNVNHGNNRDESNSMRRKLNEDLRKLFNGEFNIPINIETDNNLINRVNNLRNRKAVLDTNKQNTTTLLSQIEINTISCSFGAATSQLTRLHRYFLNSTNNQTFIDKVLFIILFYLLNLFF